MVVQMLTDADQETRTLVGAKLRRQEPLYRLSCKLQTIYVEETF